MELHDLNNNDPSPTVGVMKVATQMFQEILISTVSIFKKSDIYFLIGIHSMQG